MKGRRRMSEPITTEQARAMLAQERQARADACGKEIAAALEKHKCQLIGTPAFTPDGRVVVNMNVVAQ